MSGRRRLLFVSPRCLFPMDEGGKIRSANTLRAMKGGAFELTLAMPAPDGVVSPEAAGCCDRLVVWPAPGRRSVRRLASLAGSLPVGAAGDQSRAGSRAIAAELAATRPDLVVVDFPHAEVLLPEEIPARRVLFTHNVEAEIFERHAGKARGLWRLVWRDQARKMARFEAAALGRAHTAIAVSTRDGAELSRRYGHGRIRSIDTGVDLDYFTPLAEPPAEPETVVFTGVMDSPANTDGIAFLMDDIWPLLAARRPGARALIVGRNPPDALIRAARERGLNWEFTGRVPDIREHVAHAHVAVIPLRVGSGTRIKAFEAMAMGRAVVGTTVGMEGLDVIPGEHFELADSAPAFADAAARLLADAGARRAMAAAARARLEARFSWGAVGRQFEAICLEAIEGPAG